MKHKLMVEDAGERQFLLVLDEGEEAFAAIAGFAERQAITAASITAIGAFRTARIAFFDFSTKQYTSIPVETQTEVLSLIGDIAVDDEGKVSPHLHVVLGLSDGTTRGGHFQEGIVRPTLEVVLRETPAYLRRRHRPDLGIALIDIDT